MTQILRCTRKKVAPTWVSSFTMLLFVAGTCSFQVRNIAGQIPDAAPLTVAEARAKLSQAEQNLQCLQQQARAPKLGPSEIQKLQDEATRLRTAANYARTRAEAIRQQSLKVGKNPDDPREAPITYRAAQIAKAAEVSADEAERRLATARNTGEASQGGVIQAQQAVAQARKDLNDSIQRSQDANASSPSASTQTLSTPGSGGMTSVESDWFDTGNLVLFTGLVLAIALIGASGFVLFVREVRLKRRIDELEARQDKFIRSAGGEVSYAESSTKSFERHLSDMTSQLNEVQQRVEVDHLGLEDLRRQLTWHRTAVSSAPQPEAHDPLFPAAVEECLARWRATDTKMVSVRHLLGQFVEAEKGEFLLVMGDDPKRPLLIIPSVVRFSTKQDYYAYFAEFYHCDKVTSGQVWIVEPALANRIQGGWSLGEKGRLDIR